LEKNGIPTAVICSDAFLSLARSTSRAKGISTPRLVEIPHPLAGIAPDEVQKKAENAVDTIIAVLLDSARDKETSNGHENHRL
jgi:hypothetical protein